MQYVTKKGFLNEGVYAKRGSTIQADGARAKELLRLGLVEEVKASAPASNKMMPDSQNKAADSPGDADSGASTDSPTDVPDDGAPATAGTPARTPAEDFVDRTAADVIKAIKGADKGLLELALEAEKAKGDKARKGVLDALTAALEG